MDMHRNDVIECVSDQEEPVDLETVCGLDQHYSDLELHRWRKGAIKNGWISTVTSGPERIEASPFRDPKRR